MQRPVPSIRLRIVPKEPTGGTIYALGTIVNATNRAFWINTRFLSGFPGEPPSALRELWFDIRSKKGPAVFTCKVCLPRPVASSDYRLLQPGESLEFERDLHCYDLSSLGEYTVVLHYRDGQEKPTQPPANAVPVTQELVSEPVTFKVLGG
jgi:hypothetical protein